METGKTHMGTLSQRGLRRSWDALQGNFWIRTAPIVQQGLVVGFALLVLGGAGCHKKKPKPQEPVPTPMFPKRKLSSFDEELKARLGEAKGPLCTRATVWRSRSAAGDGTEEFARVMGRREDAEACLSKEEGAAEACQSFWESLKSAVSHGHVCSPFGVGGRARVRVTPDLLVRSAGAVAARSGRPGTLARFRPLLLAGLALWDMARGPVTWDLVQSVAEAQQKLIRRLSREMNLVAGERRGRIRGIDRLASALAQLSHASPPVRGPLLGEHLRILGRLGLVHDLRGGETGPMLLPKGPLSNSRADRRAFEDLAALVRVVADTNFDVAWKDCPPGDLLSVCQTRLARLDRVTGEKLEELRREFAARYEEFPAFQRLVDHLAARLGSARTAGPKATPGRRRVQGGAKGPDAGAGGRPSVERYWAVLLRRVGSGERPALVDLGRAGFLIDAALLQARIQQFVQEHPTRAIFSEVAPLAFKSRDPYSGKPLTVRKTDAGLRILPPAESEALGKVSLEVLLKRP